MKRYSIKKGRKAFRPMAPLLPALVYTGFEFTAVLDKSCWFSADQAGGDKDREDWLKLTGITAAFSLNNRRSALIAFRPTDVPDVFAITAYTNDKKSGKQIGGTGFKIATVKAGDRFSGLVRFEQYLFTDAVEYYIDTPNGTFTATHDFEKPWHSLYREISPRWGGAAPNDATLMLDFKWTK